jgi:hypothetical protein
VPQALGKKSDVLFELGSVVAALHEFSRHKRAEVKESIRWQIR